ncbi:MAG: 30S ribosomal protein S3 [Patescibacteria group bacterium]
MGHKVHPRAQRLQVIDSWDSRWFSPFSQYRIWLQEEIKIRTYLGKKFKEAGIDRIIIERSPREMIINMRVAKPGIIIGRGGQGADEVRVYLERRMVKSGTKVRLNVQEVKNASLSAAVVLTQVTADLEKRIAFRRVMKQTMAKVMKAGAQGVKIAMAGRLNGAEIARREKLALGKIPLQTLRSDVDYAQGYAHTIYGSIGVKVWIYRGPVFVRKDLAE